MKITRTEVLIKKGSFPDSNYCSMLFNEVYSAIQQVHWPPNTVGFSINPQKHGNGVKPIKSACMNYLSMNGWSLETKVNIEATRRRPGPIDATKQYEKQYFGVEWETGNISSSHRSMNKMCLGLMNKILIGGILIIPSGNLYPFLTDRIGSFPELEPYYRFWKRFSIDHGILAVVEVEQDFADSSVALIPKGTDGRALL